MLNVQSISNNTKFEKWNKRPYICDMARLFYLMRRTRRLNRVSKINSWNSIPILIFRLIQLKILSINNSIYFSEGWSLLYHFPIHDQYNFFIDPGKMKSNDGLLLSDLNIHKSIDEYRKAFYCLSDNLLGHWFLNSHKTTQLIFFCF